MLRDSIRELEAKWVGISIIEDLKNNDENLYNYVVEACIIGINECDKINNSFDEFTDHSSLHSLEVLKNGDSFLKDINLNKIEIAIFVLSCYFHDIGMNIKTEQINDYKKRNDYALEREYLIDKIAIRNEIEENKITPEIVDKFILLEYVRERHHTLSKEWILSNFPDIKEESYINIDNSKQYIWKYVADICESHCLRLEQINDKNFGSVPIARSNVDLIFVSCLLRISDYCHIGRDRALPYLRISKDFYSAYSKKIWESLSCVNGIIFEHETHRLIISADCNNEIIHNTLIKEAANIDDELHEQIKHLVKYHSKYQHTYFFVDSSKIKEADNAPYIYSPNGFKMNYSKITKLLIGSKLYSEDLYALREIIQNSMDALSVQKLKMPFVDTYILLNYRCIENKCELEIYDNGTGMNKDICLDNFLSIGDNSFWSTKTCFNEFGIAKEHIGLISSHGIGVLSYFLIANEIEIYSKYKNSEPIHMRITGYDQNVVFKKTSEANFPVFNQDISKLQTPWEQGHGTCVRLILKKNYSIKELVEFISRHIIKARHKIFIIDTSNNDGFAELPNNNNPLREPDALLNNDISNYKENFSYRNTDNDFINLENPKEFFESIRGTGMSFGELIKEIEDNNLLKSELSIPAYSIGRNNDILSLSEIVTMNYKEYQPDFYNGLYDRGITITYDYEDISGKFYLEIDGHKQIRNRVSQNGIWIKNGHKFIDKMILKNINIDNDFISYDINISYAYFDLSASRDYIVDCDYNRGQAEHIVKIILSQIPILIENIEYVLAFPCGRKWYHGIRSLLYKLPESDWHFIYQKTLHKLYTVFENNGEIYASFNKGKLYHAFEGDSNLSYSVDDIAKKANEFLILMPIYINSDDGLYGIDNYDSDYEKKHKVDLNDLSESRCDKIIHYAEKCSQKIIYFPDYLQSFKNHY